MATRSTSVPVSIAGRSLALTNLDKVLYPGNSYTKSEVIAYYQDISATILPHLRDRVITRVRFPNGTAKPAFYEKNRPTGCPDWIRTQTVRASDGTVDYVLADDAAALAYLANLAALELHTPLWRTSNITALRGEVDLAEARSDLLVIDLDPGDQVTIVECAQGALMAAAVLAEDDLVPVAKATGGKGIQVHAVIAPTPSAQVKEYVSAVADELMRRYPGKFVTAIAKAERVGKLLIDIMQNSASRNSISVYSLRGREVPTVATPVTWEEVAAVDGPDQLRFTPDAVRRRVAAHGDLASDLLLGNPPPLPHRRRITSA